MIGHIVSSLLRELIKLHLPGDADERLVVYRRLLQACQAQGGAETQCWESLHALVKEAFLDPGFRGRPELMLALSRVMMLSDEEGNEGSFYESLRHCLMRQANASERSRFLAFLLLDAKKFLGIAEKGLATKLFQEALKLLPREGAYGLMLVYLPQLAELHEEAGDALKGLLCRQHAWQMSRHIGTPSEKKSLRLAFRKAFHAYLQDPECGLKLQSQWMHLGNEKGHEPLAELSFSEEEERSNPPSGNLHLLLQLSRAFCEGDAKHSEKSALCRVAFQLAVAHHQEDFLHPLMHIQKALAEEAENWKEAELFRQRLAMLTWY